jgi:hypothetical protein
VTASRRAVNPRPYIGCRRANSSQPRRPGEVDPESVSLPLIAAGHLGTGVAELPLDVALIGLCGSRKACAQGVSREFPPPLGFRKITTNPGSQRRALDQPGDVPVGEPVGTGLRARSLAKGASASRAP